MKRRGNCHDNAVAESFFSCADLRFNLPRRERVRRKVYPTRAEARQDVFDSIEMFLHPTRKHPWNGMLSPVEFERQPQPELFFAAWRQRPGLVPTIALKARLNEGRSS